MASDITLAVGDGARRMTYAELAAVRGTSQPAFCRAFKDYWTRVKPVRLTPLACAGRMACFRATAARMIVASDKGGADDG